MRTTIEIDDDLLQEALAVTKTSSKKKLIEIALRELLRHKSRERLKKRIGGYRGFSLTHSKLRKLREGA